MTQPSSRQEELNLLLKQTYDRGFSDGKAAALAEAETEPETWEDKWRSFLVQLRTWAVGLCAAGVFFFLGYFVGTPDKQEIAMAVSNATGIAALILIGIVALPFLRGKK